jgi:filamentous hemagglutinin
MSRRTQPEKPNIPSWMRIAGFIIIALFAAVSAWQNLGADTSTAIPPIRTSAPVATEDAAAAETPQTADDADALIVRDVSIYDVDGDLAYAGDVDLAPTLDRIERGESDPHDNDGAVFQNREGLLPAQDRGYYHEYVVRTPGLDAVGPQRLILGAEGEVYYTPDHYATFTRIR